MCYKSVSGVCGFTRETYIAITTNTESHAWRRWEFASAGIPPEHPHASSSEDVEFICLCDNVGKIFTLKEVQVKVCMEFT